MGTRQAHLKGPSNKRREQLLWGGDRLSLLRQPESPPGVPPLQVLHNYYYRGYDDAVLYLRRLSKYHVEPR